MKPKKLIRYRLGVSRVFPKGHPRAGQQTYFVEHITNEINGHQFCSGNCSICSKSHTIRSNYPLWEKRMQKVQAGEAVIELFYWEGKPYNSKQIVFATLDKDSGCGIQELTFSSSQFNCMLVDDKYCFSDIENSIAKNDGLSFEDFEAWFRGYDLSKSLAIIHFTKFRY